LSSERVSESSEILITIIINGIIKLEEYYSYATSLSVANNYNRLNNNSIDCVFTIDGRELVEMFGAEEIVGFFYCNPVSVRRVL
jgi:hypothetical protein